MVFTESCIFKYANNTEIGYIEFMASNQLEMSGRKRKVVNEGYEIKGIGKIKKLESPTENTSQ